MTGIKNYYMKYEPLMALLSKLFTVVYIGFLSVSQWEKDYWLLGYYLFECAYTQTNTTNMHTAGLEDKRCSSKILISAFQMRPTFLC